MLFRSRSSDANRKPGRPAGPARLQPRPFQAINTTPVALGPWLSPRRSACRGAVRGALSPTPRLSSFFSVHYLPTVGRASCVNFLTAVFAPSPHPSPRRPEALGPSQVAFPPPLPGAPLPPPGRIPVPDPGLPRGSRMGCREHPSRFHLDHRCADCGGRSRPTTQRKAGRPPPSHAEATTCGPRRPAPSQVVRTEQLRPRVNSWATKTADQAVLRGSRPQATAWTAQPDGGGGAVSS